MEKSKVTKEQKVEYFKKVNQNIEKHGFHVTCVLEDIETTPFGYSTGIYKNFEIPELFISGLPSGLTQELIEQYASKYKFQNVPIKKLISDLIDRFAVYFIEVENNALVEYVLSSIKFYENQDYKYLQLIFPDLNGYFPNHQNYNYDQEIFGKITHL